ncbi:MAG TPA: flagellar biosynthesis protein FlgB [Hyphomonas sp.]|nr:flagellar biosynthesis protein FlgB [Hyphomonas sp.]
MISQLPLFEIYGAMARYSAESQKVSATNIAHANEPGYKAKELEPFESYLARAASAGQAGLNTGFKVIESGTPVSPNGNSVSVEMEMFKSAEAAGQHNQAMAVYTKSLDLLRTALGR